MGVVLALLAGFAAQAAQSTTAPAPPPVAPEPLKGRNVGQLTYVDLEGGAGYSTNPQFSLGSNTGSANGYVSVHVAHTRITDRTTTLLSAFAQETAYTHNYGSNQSISITARHDAAVNERLRLFADASAGYDKNGQLDTRIIGVPNVPVLPGAPDVPPQILPPGSDFLAVTGKHYFFSGNVGGQFELSARDSLDFSTGTQRSVFRSAGADSGYWSVPASIGYSRKLSPNADLGGRVGVLYTNYDGPGRIWTVTPQITGRLQISERLSLNGAVGASLSSINDGTHTRHSTGLALNGALCNAGEYSQLCARAGIDQTAATVAGPAKTVSAGVDYSRRLDANSSVQLSVDGSHYSSPTSFISGRTFSASTYYRAAASYTRSVGRRLYGGVNLAARKLTERGPDPKADFNASLFIRYRFGDMQ